MLRSDDLERPAGSRWPFLIRIGVPLVVFSYLVFVRTRRISETFWLLGDQILYWRIALGSWRDLPVSGGPSSVGGTTLGPVFVWVLWVIRQVVGPWTHNLPHAGGIGLGILQSAADTLLLVAVWKRLRSLALALAAVLVIATAPYDMALSATIWNPPLAVALVKTTLALVFLGDGHRSIAWSVAPTATALLAVQAHSSALFFFGPVAVAFIVRELFAHRWTRAMQLAGVSCAVILVLEVPYLLSFVLHPERTSAPGIVVNSVGYTLAHPRSLRPGVSLRALLDSCRFILLRPWTGSWFGPVLIASAVVTAVRMRREIPIAFATVLPLATAVAGFSFWQLPFDSYWFLVSAPSAVLTIGLALTAWRPAAPLVAAALAVAAICIQPWRAADAMTIHRLPEYGPLARGSMEIRRRTSEIRRIDTDFVLPPSTDRGFLYEALGGRMTRDSGFTARIDRAGNVTFLPVRDGS